MTRELHTRDICELSDKTLQTELTNHLNGDVLVVAPEDDRLKSLIPIKGQITLLDTQLTFPDGTEFFTAPLYNSQQEQDSYLPHNNDERFHFDDNAFDTVVSLFSLCGYFQRAPPFLDLTRVTTSGGTILSLTGLQPEKDAHHDAKWWVPNSDDADLETIVVMNHEQFQTPTLMSVFTVTASTAQNPNAEIVTQ